MRLRGSEQIGITHFQKYYAFRNFLEKYYILSALFRGLFENVLQKQIKTIILDRFFRSRIFPHSRFASFRSPEPNRTENVVSKACYVISRMFFLFFASLWSGTSFVNALFHILSSQNALFLLLFPIVRLFSLISPIGKFCRRSCGFSPFRDSRALFRTHGFLPCRRSWVAS